MTADHEPLSAHLLRLRAAFHERLLARKGIAAKTEDIVKVVRRFGDRDVQILFESLPFLRHITVLFKKRGPL